MKYHSFLFIILQCVLFNVSIAQDDLYIHGYVVEKNSTKILGAVVSIQRDGVDFETVYSDSTGYFEMMLDLGYLYDIKISKSTYVYKILQFETRNIIPEDMDGGFEYPLEIMLFQPLEGMDLSVFDEPIGKARYVYESNSIEFDHAYTANRKQVILKETHRVELIDFEQKKESDKRFKKMVAKGDKKHVQDKMLKAINWYKKALEIFPNTGVVERKIEEVYKEMG